MKKLILLLFVPIIMLNCSSDDDNGTEETIESNSSVRFLQVNSETDQVWISNFGDATVNIGDYWLCLGPGTYQQISNIATGSTEIAPQANIMLPYNVNEASSGLSLFSSNSFGSSDPEILLDYVQWGAENQARVGQAVTAGRWDANSNFVEGGPLYSFSGSASDSGSSFWNN